MPNSAIKLYMIPGTGTDQRMFTPQLEQFPDMIVPAWLPPQSLKEPLASYAKRLAEQIDTSQPFVLGGVSLGGMIAQEMALTLKPQAVILIATCSSYKALPLKWRLAGKLMRLLPDGVVKFLFHWLARMVDATHSRRKGIYAAMLREMPAYLVRWQSGAATEWTLKGALSMPIFHIHGDKDTIIPIKNVKPQKIVHNGSHLISATNESEVNAFISQCVAKVSPAQAMPHEGEKLTAI